MSKYFYLVGESVLEMDISLDELSELESLKLMIDGRYQRVYPVDPYWKGILEVSANGSMRLTYDYLAWQAYADWIEELGLDRLAQRCRIERLPPTANQLKLQEVPEEYVNCEPQTLQWVSPDGKYVAKYVLPQCLKWIRGQRVETMMAEEVLNLYHTESDLQYFPETIMVFLGNYNIICRKKIIVGHPKSFEHIVEAPFSYSLLKRYGTKLYINGEEWL